MRKTVLEMYAALVCFSMVTCFTVALGIILYGVVAYVNPALTMNTPGYEAFQSNDRFWRAEASMGGPSFMPGTRPPEATVPARPSEDELTRRRLEAYDMALQSERRGALQSFLRWGIAALVSLLAFSFHWRFLSRTRGTNTV